MFNYISININLDVLNAQGLFCFKNILFDMTLCLSPYVLKQIVLIYLCLKYYLVKIINKKIKRNDFLLSNLINN